MSFYRVFVFVYTVWLHILHIFADGSSCSHKYLHQRESHCIGVFNLTSHIVSGIPNLLFGDSLEEFCEHVPGVIPCLQESFEPCQDPYYDFRSYNRTFTTVCGDRTLYMYSEAYCDETVAVLKTCFGEYKSNVHTLKTINNVTRCLVLNRLRDCLHINESSLCKRGYSQFLTSLYRGRFSSEICDVYTSSDWSKYSLASDHGKELYQGAGNRATGMRLDTRSAAILWAVFTRLYKYCLT